MTLAYVKTSVNNAIKITKSIMLSGCRAPASLWTLRRIFEETRNCEVGLQNLRSTTYATDSMMVANLDVIVERQRAHRHDLYRHYNEIQTSDASEISETTMNHENPEKIEASDLQTV